MRILIIIIVLAVIQSGCATIVSKSRYDIAVKSYPSDADFKITDRRNNIVHTGTTPAVVKLKASGGFLRRAIYTVDFQKPGYEKSSELLNFKFDPWYLGNFLFPGLIGLIIDPFTGAIYQPNVPFVMKGLQRSEDDYDEPSKDTDDSKSKWDRPPSRWD